MANLLLISGSLRSGSTNSATLRTAAALAPAGIEAEIYDEMGRLPHFNPDDDPTDGVGLDVEVATLRSALATGAQIVEEACLRLPLARDYIGADGLIAPPEAREAIVATVRTLAAVAP